MHNLRQSLLALAFLTLSSAASANAFRSINQEQQVVYMPDGTLAAIEPAKRVDGLELNPGFATVVTESDPQKPMPRTSLVSQANATPVQPLPPAYYASRSQSDAITCKPHKGKLFLTDYASYISMASARFGVEEALIRAIIHTESAFRPKAKSPKKAQGLMQLIPATAARFNVQNVYDPFQNIQGGVEYLAWLLRRYNGDIRLAAAGYNAGEGKVDRFRGIPPYKETINYVSRVLTLLDQYRNYGSSYAGTNGNYRVIC